MLCCLCPGSARVSVSGISSWAPSGCSISHSHFEQHLPPTSRGGTWLWARPFAVAIHEQTVWVATRQRGGVLQTSSFFATGASNRASDQPWRSVVIQEPCSRAFVGRDRLLAARDASARARRPLRRRHRSASDQRNGGGAARSTARRLIHHHDLSQHTHTHPSCLPPKTHNQA